MGRITKSPQLIIASLIAFLCITGCHSYVLDDAQFDLRKSFTNGDIAKSEKLLKQFEQKDIYRSKDLVLYNLESGLVNHFAGNYDTSSVFLTNAENIIEENYTKSISRGIGAFLINDNKLVYDGEPYEDVYLNAFKALNYIHLQNWEAALVETRKMAYKMEQLDIKIKGLAEAFAKSDSTNRATWDTGNINVQNSALSHYLAAVLFAKARNYDAARIEQEKLQIALREQATLSSNISSDKNYNFIRNEDSYNVLLTGFSGQAPFKIQKDARIFLGDSNPNSNNDLYLKFSFPELRTYPSKVHNIRAVVNDSLVSYLDLIEEMDEVSADVYKAKESIIYSRALIRASVKAASTKIISNIVRKENELIGDLLEILGFVSQEATEKADLRAWQTMPGKAWMQVIKLPVGLHTVRLEYVSNTGRILYYDQYEVTVTPQTELELVESIYSN